MRSRSHVASKRANDEHAQQADHGYAARRRKRGSRPPFPKEIHIKHPFASTNDPVLRPVRRGFLQASGLVLSGTAIALLAGREALATEVQDVTALRRGIDETHRRFEDMFNRGDAAGAARQLYTRDARILPPGAETVQGRDRIAEYWAAAAAAPQTGVRRVELSTLDLQPLGDGAYEIGRATLTLASGQRVTPRYFVVWKQEDGAWRRREDIWNMDTA